MAVSTRVDGNVLIVTADNPPVNALSQAVRAGLSDAIEAAAANAAVEAVVVRCAGRTFFAGADITEFGKPLERPGLPELVDTIEASAKPVVAAIHGTALGGGLEVALGCHYRIAAPSAKLGLPEVKLGLLPGAGGTQRLPRVVGVAEALPMIVLGNPISATKAHSIGLVDRIAPENELEAAAIAFARTVVGKERPVASERADKRAEAVRDPAMFDRFTREQGRRIKGFDAPAACIEAVRAAVDRPFAEGARLERELFVKLVGGDQSKAQRHLFFAERAAGKVDDVPGNTPLLPVNTVGIIGAGTMGGGIAMNFLSAGIPVTLLEMRQDALDHGVGIIRRNYENSARRGRMTPEQVEKAVGLITPTLSYDDLPVCDLVIEAVFETMAVKKDVFGKLDAAVKKGAILASNTSYLDVDEIAAATSRPESVLGLHFFSPANVMTLLEVVRGAKTAMPVLATAMALGKTIGKTAVVSGVCHGFIGNRMLSPRQREANKLVLEGATPWGVDRVLADFGFPMGPFQMSDLAGLDIGWHRDPARIETIRDALCAAGRWGQKTGHGFYDYDEARNRTPSDAVDAIIAEFRATGGYAPRDIGDPEILERLLYPMVNEGALILEEGIAQRASDIDVVWVSGYGWPAFTGGPMFWADTIGLDKVVAGLKAHADKLAPEFTMSALLEKKAAAGERLTS